MTHARRIRHSAKVVPPQTFPNLLHVVHAPTIWQYISQRKGQNIAADERQNRAMPQPDYRRVLRENLALLLDASGYSTNTLRATYVFGPKKGKVVSSRSVRYILDDDPESPSPSLDTIAAIAARLGVQAHSLLSPGLDIVRPPVAKSNKTMRQLQQVARRVDRLMQEYGDLDALRTDHGDAASPSTVGNAHPDRKVPNRGTKTTKRAPKT